MSFMGFGLNRFRQGGGFGRKGTGEGSPSPSRQGIFGSRDELAAGGSPFERLVALAAGEIGSGRGFTAYLHTNTMKTMSPEERGDLLVDLAGRPGVYAGMQSDSIEAQVASNAYWTVWAHDIEVKKEHLASLLQHLLEHPGYRRHSYLDKQFGGLLRVIGEAIRQGAYLTSGDCEAIGAMAADIRGGQSRYSKADTKKMIARAERLEKLAGVEISGTEFLMQRCEGAENPHAILAKPRPNAQFWADLLAEVTAALDEIRLATKGSVKPAWARSAEAFAAAWPACGSVEPSYARWRAGDQPVKALKEDNGKRNGWADPEAYRRLPETIALAEAHSRYVWKSSQIPGLDVFADLENPDWTALIEHLIVRRRTPRAAKAWQKQALALAAPIGLATVEARLHDWLALFHSPALGREAFTQTLNGERFASAIDRLEQAHPDWPQRHEHEIPALGRAVAIAVASGPGHGLCDDFRPQLVRLDDYTYKNRSATTGVLGMRNPSYVGGSYRDNLAGWMRLSLENEEFLRGAMWLAALMPDQARAVRALELTALAAATYTTVGDDAMRSKVIANAAIATLLDMGGPEIDAAVLRLSKGVEHQTIRAPLMDYLNGAA